MFSASHATIGSVSRNDLPGRMMDRAAPPRLKSVGGRTEPTPERSHLEVDDAALATEALAGRRWAQREIWYRFAPMVYGLFRRSLSPRHDHEDLVQEVFMRIFRRLPTLQKATALRSFIYSVALRVMSEEIRHFQVLRRARAQLVLMADTSRGVPVDYEARDTLLRIQNVLDGMKDKQRAVFILRHVEGMDLQEVADGLDISLATVKRYLAKAIVAIERATVRDQTLKARLGLAPSAKPAGGTG
jgi:RNA polymerase sigma-70 factor (ECF subfamily)